MCSQVEDVKRPAFFLFVCLFVCLDMALAQFPLWWCQVNGVQVVMATPFLFSANNCIFFCCGLVGLLNRKDGGGRGSKLAGVDPQTSGGE